MRNILKNDMIWYILSKYASLGMSSVASVLIAAKLGPYYFGIWSFILLVYGLGASCDWGIGNAVTVLLVQYKEDHSKLEAYTLNSFYLTLLIGIIPVFCCLCLDFFCVGIIEKFQLGVVNYLIAILVIISYLSSLLMNISRINNYIKTISVTQMIWPMLMMIAILCGHGKSLLQLLIVLFTLSSILVVGIYFYTKPIAWKSNFSWEIIRQIFSKGFFLFLYNSGFLFIILSTKLIVSKFYKVEEFGYFAFAFALANGVILLVNSIIFLIFPRIIDLLKGNDNEKNLVIIKEIRSVYLYFLHAIFYVAIICACFFFSIFDAYEKSFHSFLLILSSVLIYSGCFGYNFYLLAHDKERTLALASLVALILNIGIAMALVKLQVRFDYIIISTLISFVVYSLIVIVFAVKFNSMTLGALLNEPISLRLIPFYIVTLLLVFFMASKILFIIPLFLFLVFNCKKMREIFFKTVKLYKNKKYVN